MVHTLRVRSTVAGETGVRLELCCRVSLLGRGRVWGRGTWKAGNTHHILTKSIMKAPEKNKAQALFSELQLCQGLSIWQGDFDKIRWKYGRWEKVIQQVLRCFSTLFNKKRLKTGVLKGPCLLHKQIPIFLLWDILWSTILLYWYAKILPKPTLAHSVPIQYMGYSDLLSSEVQFLKRGSYKPSESQDHETNQNRFAIQ